MYQIVASDLDGTLLQSDHTLSPFAKETLKLISQHGVNFIFATGRHHVDVGQIRDGLGIDSYMITSNGARVHNGQGELLFSHNLDEEIAYELFRIVNDSADIETHVYRNDDWLTNRESEDLKNFHKESDFSYQLFEPNSMATDGICKVFYTCTNHETLLRLEEKINSRWHGQVNASFSLDYCLEIMGAGVSKGHALQDVSGILGYELKDCITFGDGMNDKEMLSMAGKGCIMKNASPRLKQTLPQLEVIGSNVDDAVMHYLRKLYL
ncbi:sugar/pyridoxal phosphate phosphatase YigL [Budviciaceae bacterium CWB-B4]|uniref:Sugar/pyridoxal phosphate phosphatase YigL n=1 Tax=Limnobaculum xujianqingii TaxID=2738837 RepID=A0A9D7AKC1_9GAMM|nr:sugar/pyridoxal phosphate phosphatase YigL [Limnobaculum xujianqingii]MBK5074268.1 sugar/pyridoxal phosphate phosphatase YigL [Limnobaculum xujianqingii]MBK5177577.1 sugar/pyridoxal phosphate phosphatase YigL [Limnobaculum xujianqingii]